MQSRIVPPTPEDATVLSLAIDIDGVLTNIHGHLPIAANERFGTSYPESAFIDSAGLNVPEETREWVYSPDGPASNCGQPRARRRFFKRCSIFAAPKTFGLSRPDRNAPLT